MTIAEIKAFLKANKEKDEVKQLIGEISVIDVNSDKFKSTLFANVDGREQLTDEAYKMLQSQFDRKTTQGIESWKEKNLKSEIEKGIELFKKDSEFKETKTPSDLRIEELEKKIAINEQRESINNLRKNLTSNENFEGFDPRYFNLVNTNDENKAIELMNQIKDIRLSEQTKMTDAHKKEIDDMKIEFKKSSSRSDVPNGENLVDETTPAGKMISMYDAPISN